MKYKELQEKFGRIVSHLNEKSKRLWCANEAMSLGRGGITLVSAATGVSGTTITEGVKEIKGEKEVRQDITAGNEIGTNNGKIGLSVHRINMK
ncbi:MAG: hypothetical protein HC887_13115 [Desulfobacteraceae bacterium]|nr:hypothetical protein [Desulfobacteraceae bacterium]